MIVCIAFSPTLGCRSKRTLAATPAQPLCGSLLLHHELDRRPVAGVGVNPANDLALELQQAERLTRQVDREIRRGTRRAIRSARGRRSRLAEKPIVDRACSCGLEPPPLGLGAATHWWLACRHLHQLRAPTRRRNRIMKVSDIIQIKGSVVKTVRSETSARELSVRLHADQIGAMVVSSDGRSIDGIVTERDLAYGLAAHGSDLPTIAVSRLMTNVVDVCSPEDSITHVMKLMTQRRVRHLPVKQGDQLVGIISIGDVLKHRLDELELEANVMRDYAVAARR